MKKQNESKTEAKKQRNKKTEEAVEEVKTEEAVEEVKTEEAVEEVKTEEAVEEVNNDTVVVDIETLRHKQTKVQTEAEFMITLEILRGRYEIAQTSKKVYWGLKIQQSNKTLCEYYAKRIAVRIVIKDKQFERLSADTKAFLQSRTVFKTIDEEEYEIKNEFVLTQNEALAIIDELVNAK